jgi:hypothetical protein
MSAVVPFPGRYRPSPKPPLPDATPIGRPCCVIVEPDEDGWNVLECSESGAGWLGGGLPKWQAIAIALDWVRRRNAELTISNSSGESGS